MKFFGVFLVICVFRACSSETTSDGAVKSPSHIVLRLASRKFLLCEGFLIGKNVAVTAAGCVDKYKSIPSNLEVVAGVTSTDNIESEKKIQTRRAAEVLIHPDFYTSKKRQADIAVIKFTRPVKITENVDIASYGNESAIQRMAKLVGYGYEDKKSETELKVISTEDCKSYVQPEFKDGWFCTKSKAGEGEEDIHYAGSAYAGAPLYYSDIDEVVVCGLSPSRSSATFVDLTYYAPWIEKNTNISSIKTPQPATTTASTSDPTTTTSTTTTN